jgi:hypothetical protein
MKALLASVSFLLLVSSSPVFAQKSPASLPVLPEKGEQMPTTAAPSVTTVAPVDLAPEECLRRVHNIEPMMPKIMEGARAAISAIVPDPDAYEKTLPALDKVVADKDDKALMNIGGLSEAFLYAGNKEKGKKYFSFFCDNADTILGAEHPFPGLVKGDVGLLLFTEDNYKDAEPLLLESLKKLEANPISANSNNLITNYMCLALINDKGGSKDKALSYAKKMVDLSIKQRQPAK